MKGFNKINGLDNNLDINSINNLGDFGNVNSKIDISKQFAVI